MVYAARDIAIQQHITIKAPKPASDVPHTATVAQVREAAQPVKPVSSS